MTGNLDRRARTAIGGLLLDSGVGQNFAAGMDLASSSINFVEIIEEKNFSMYFIIMIENILIIYL